MNPGLIIILSLSLTAGLLLLHYFHKRKRREGMNDLVCRFSNLGTKYNLRFTGQVLLKNYMMGLDGQNRKLLLLGGIDDRTYRETLIELDNVKAVYYEKQFLTNDNTPGETDPFIAKIILKFHFKENLPSVIIPFYNNEINDVLSIKKMDKKARHWQVMLKKMLHTKKENQTEISPGDVLVT